MHVSSSRVPAPHPGAGDGVNRSWTGNLNVLFRNGQYRLHSDAIRSEHRSTMPIRLTDDSVLHLQTYLSEGTWGAGKRVPEPERAGWGEEGLRNHSISSKKATFVYLTATHAFSLGFVALVFPDQGGGISIVLNHCQKTYRPSHDVFSVLSWAYKSSLREGISSMQDGIM